MSDDLARAVAVVEDSIRDLRIGLNALEADLKRLRDASQ